MSKKILLVVHQEHSDPGRVAEVLERRGHATEICRPCIGHTLPASLEAVEAVVVFGGPMSANDCQTLPFIRTELDWIPNVLAAEVPFLGICLGAQMLARVIGGRVSEHPEGKAEIGYYPIQPTEAGRALFPDALQVYQWHREGFELGPGAELLATGETFFNQAFRYGRNAYGIQFHPEVTHKIMERWTTKGAHRLVLPGAQPREAHFEGHARHDERLGDWLERFFDWWLGPNSAVPSSGQR
jgi:GMP synthase (glutamine-hydrolysing)